MSENNKDTRYQNVQQGGIVNAVQWDNHPSTLDLLGLSIQGTQNLELKSVTFFGKDRKKQHTLAIGLLNTLMDSSTF